MVTSRFNLFGVPAAMLAATILSLSFGSSCSGLVSDDVFYVYVVNGYAGGGDLTVYSSTGPIAQDLAFGEVSNKIALDRTRRPARPAPHAQQLDLVTRPCRKLPSIYN